MQSVSQVGVIGKFRNQEALDTVSALCQHLKARGISVILEAVTAAALQEHGFENTENYLTSSREEMGQQAQLVLVVGGDGSLLNAARALSVHNVPVMGINRGRLGFLTDIHPDDMFSLVDQVLDGKYVEEQRFLIECQVMRQGEKVGEGRALNDIVLHLGKILRMIEFEVTVDDHFVYRQRADGIIVATPTGSTAYALSAGGPIMHPTIDAISLVPMNAHTLNSRPIVIPGDSQIELLITDNNETSPQLSCDGQVHLPLAPGDRVLIKKQANRLKLIHPHDQNYFQVLRSKLQWNNN